MARRKDTVEVYQRTTKKIVDRTWDWRRIDAYNGQVTATSGGQGYVRKGYCVSMAKKRNPDCIVVVVA